MKSLLAIAVLLLTGCGTFVSQQMARDFRPRQAVVPYSGVKFDVSVLDMACDGRLAYEWPVLPFVAIDLPLSTIADTLMLPFADWGTK